ncbi:MAG TPA: tetratricopeptide repeat protein [Stenomitos sp.]
MKFRPALAALLLATMVATPGAWAAVEPTEPALRTAFQQLQSLMDRDDSQAALKLAGECLEAARKNGNLALVAEALLMHGEVYLGLDKDKEAKSYLLNALGLAAEVGVPRVRANALNDLGIINERAGHGYAAESYYKEALAIAVTLDDPLLLDAVDFDLGAIECDQGAFDRGYPRLQSVLERSRQRKDELNAAKVLVRLASAEREMSKPEKAGPTATEALELSRKLGYYPTQQGALRILALLAMDKKDPVNAEARLKEALGVANQSQDEWAMAYAAFDLGQFYASQGRPKDAVTQLLNAQRTFRKLGKKDLVDNVRKLLNQVEGGKSL